MNKSSESPPPPPPPSFSSLPNDVVLNCLARISRFHYPTLSLVSKSFRSLIASPELETIRSLIGKPENHLCVCLKLNNNPNPLWFTVSPIPKQKLKPIPSFPQQQYPQYPTVVSNGSEIYIIGGFVRRKRIRRVLILDCRSQQWRRLPKMRQPRASPAAYVLKSMIVVIGGCRSKNLETWGEVYDPKNNTWGRLLLQSLDLTIQNVYLNGFKPYLDTNSCLVKIDKVSCVLSVSNGNLFWREMKEGFEWSSVMGVEEVSTIISVSNASGEGRVTVWWKSLTLDLVSMTEEYETKIWCAEISFERRGLTELWGFVDWSKEVFAVDGYDSTYDFFLNSAIVTY